MEQTIQSPIRNYLKKNFEIDGKKDLETAQRDVSSHFWATYSVHVWCVGNLFLFKYAQSLCERWDLPHILECRGIIMRRNEMEREWEIASRPFDKVLKEDFHNNPF
jgi:hypothetical protein